MKSASYASIDLGTSNRTVKQRRKSSETYTQSEAVCIFEASTHELFDPDFQMELATVFKDSSVGLSPNTTHPHN